jgi:AbrB family looped-hinge helix DNA binding protein
MATNYITMDAAGHLIVPEELRAEMHLEPGTRFEVRYEGQRIILEPVVETMEDLIDRLHGSTRGMDLSGLWEQIHREDKEREGL